MARNKENLAERIFARIETEQDGSTYIVAYDTEEEAVQEEGVTEVGVYKLERIKKLRKVVEEV